MSNIIDLSEKTGLSKHWSPEDALAKAQEYAKEGGKWHGRKKIIILSINQEEEVYEVSEVRAGMRNSEAIMALEYVKASLLLEMLT